MPPEPRDLDKRDEEFFHQANEARYMEGEAGDEWDDGQEDDGDWWKKDCSQ
jgi:hypothetical protein